MLATLAEPPLAQRGLVYEPKYDGIRAIVDLQPGQRTRSPAVTIYSRNGNDKTAQFPEVVEALSRIAKTLRQPVILDSEIVATDDQGRPLGFQHIQSRIHLTGASNIARAAQATPAAIVVFDMLRDGAEDLRRRPMAERRVRLQERIRPASANATVRLSEIALDDGRRLLARARREGWEGLIVKDAQSVYHSGRRTPAWRKLKLVKQQEFVIGGWTAPRQTRTHFGALLLGYYDAAGALRFAGSVGTGFDQAELDRVSAMLRARETPVSPFADRFRTAERAHWVRPDLVAEARFTEWTTDGLLRHPVYLGTREDKKAKSVVREESHRPGRPDPRRPGREQPRRPGDLSAVLDVLTGLEKNKKDGDVPLPNGDTIRVTNLAKVFWPGLNITKGDLMRYYVEVSPYLLPVVDDRPMVMKRFPNGVDAKLSFYQQRHPEAPPPGVRREILPGDIEPITEEGPRDRLIGGSLTTLMYMTQLAAISQDPWFSRVANPAHQDHAAIDLDPGDETTFDRVIDVARRVKDELDALEIPGYPKTSGASGLHVYIPLPKDATYETGVVLCQIVATLVATKYPKIATIERTVRRRPRGTVYVDYLQNILGKTLACAYSARASRYAGVSTPLEWKEVDRHLDPRDFTIRTAIARFNSVGDLWAKLRTGKPVNIERVLRKVR